MPRSPVLGLALGLACSPAFADSHWPQFRGPDSRGVSEEKDLPDTWSTTENVAWSVEIPGLGWSSPIVWGDRVFLTTTLKKGEREFPKKGLYFGGDRPKPEDEHVWRVYCLDVASGKVVWEKTVREGVPDTPIHLKNTYASETPVTDGERVYAYFGNVGVFAYTMDGELVWKKSWKPVSTRYGWGTAASPVLHGERLYIINDNDDQSFLVALERKTGEQVWRVERDEKSNWATPFIWSSGKRTEIVTPGSGKVRSYDLDGKVLWELRGMSSITIGTPFAADGLLYISSGYVGDNLRPVYAIRPGASGDITLEEGKTSSELIAWSDSRAAPYNPTPVVYKGHYYVLFDRGFFACHDAKTGKLAYKVRIATDVAGGYGGFTTSPWAYDDKIFCLNEDGDTFVIQAGPEHKVLRVNRLDEMCMATPAIARGSLFVRTYSRLYRIKG
jgi:outer membrane protein assembly factor BamB